MRTTITISDETIRQAKEISGEERLSEALARTVSEYYKHKKRREAIQWLFDNKVPHSWKKIKAERRRSHWSS